MVPGVCHEGRGVEALGVKAGVPVHGLLDRNGDNGGDKGQKARRGLRLSACAYGFNGTPADQKARHGQHHGQDDRRHALEALVPVGVFPVRGLDGELDADDDDEAAQDIGRRVHRVADHGAGMGQDAREQF